MDNEYVTDKKWIDDFIREQRTLNQELLKKQETILIEITMLKVKASLWGAITALIVSPIVAGIITLIMAKLCKV